MANGKKLYLVDGSSFVYRAFNALPPLITMRGKFTGAVYGFVQMLRKITSEHEPTHIAVAFDVSRETFRTEIYEEYKAQRAEMPEVLRSQIDDIYRVLDALDIKKVMLEGYEADDLIGTLARRAEADGFSVVIVTGDKDFYQLVSDGVALFDSMRDKWTTPTDVVERFGGQGEAVIDALALAGDPVDNIPGIPGIGEKTARSLIEKFGGLDEILSNLKRLSPSLRKKFLQHGELARRSKELVTILCDVPLDVDWGEFRYRKPDPDRLIPLLVELEFVSFIKDFFPDWQPEVTSDYKLVTDEKELAELAGKLKEAGEFSVDLETTSKDPVSAEIVGISICYRAGEAYYIPVGHRYMGAPKQLPLDEVLEVLKPILEDEGIGKVGQNLKYDAEVFERAGVRLRGIRFDSMIGAYLLNPTRNSYGLEVLSAAFLGRPKKSYKDVCGSGKAEIPFAEVKVEDARDYSCEDAEVAWLLTDEIASLLKGEGLDELFCKIEMPLIDVLKDMELWGVRIDTERLAELSGEFQRDIDELANEIYGEAGKEFNINSPQQLRVVLFEDLEIPTAGIKRTKKGGVVSTDSSVLEELSQSHRIARLILDYRKLAKLKSTYTDELPKRINPATGRIHTSFNQAGTDTGRLSSSEPNLQNIPIRTPEGRLIRQCFVPEEGHLLISADYSQIELRVLAHLSGDEGLIEAFANGEDIHSSTAAKVFGVPIDEVTSEQRNKAKIVNFRIIYGTGAYGLSRELGIDVDEAQAILDNYFKQHPAVEDFLESVLDEAQDRGFVRTLFGRRRPMPELFAGDQRQRDFGRRAAINAPMQGSAADIMKLAMIDAHKLVREKYPKVKMILQVHDELVFEAPEDEAEKLLEDVRDVMENVVELKVPLVVGAAAGRNWEEAH